MTAQIKLIKKGQVAKDALPLFTIVKNEEYLLPYFFGHYRDLGVGHFVVYDDDSEDGSREFLEAQKDCTIIGSQHLFGEMVMSPDGILPFNDVIKNSIHELFFPTSWSLYADCDEFLIIPDSFPDLHSFIDNLEKEDQLQVFGPMVDFYPEKLSDRNYKHEISPFVGCPYFDKGPVFEWDQKALRAQTVSGVRLRLKKKFAQQFPAQMSALNAGVLFNGSSVKTPLIKNGVGVLRRGAHYTNLAPCFRNQVVIAHFKFVPGFDQKLEIALRDKQYYGGSIEYKFLAKIIQHFGSSCICDQNSVRFESFYDFISSDIISLKI
tara:strand:+ start:840 stop:1802 length:963 start_codon:yes stop_codon:yes gene_type:complete